MIEIVAKLVREQTPVFLSGEIIECFVDFRNPGNSLKDTDPVEENLAWASVQIHCYKNSTLREKPETFPAIKSNTSLDKVSSQHSGDILIATKPKILFCDLRLNGGEKKSYLYRETLPITGPPTYRGYGIKYFYRITIATQRVSSKVHILNVPIRVLPLPIVTRPEEVPALCNETHEELAPTNPFLENKKTESEVEIAWHHLQNITARRLPKFYRISNKRGQVGRFCIFKSAYKLGEDIVGTLDFSSRTVRCCQVSVTLQSEEIIRNMISATGETNANTLPSSQTNECQPSEAIGRLTNYTKYHEVCIGMMQTQVIIPIPLYITPTFSTELVDVKWRLHFEFVTSAELNMGSVNSDTGEWRAPLDIPIETMIWDLPVTLYPTAPLQILQPSNNQCLIIK